MKRFLFAMLLFSLVGCGSRNSDFVEYEVMEPQPITLERVALENEMLYCDDIYVHDGRLVILNTKNKSALFSLYSLPEVKYLSECGVIGRGPNEFEFVNTRCTRSGAQGFTVGGATRFDVVDFEQGDGKLLLNKKVSMMYPSDYSSINSLLVLPNDKYVAYAANDEDVEFYLHDMASGTATPLSYYPKQMFGVDASSMACSSIFLNRLNLAPDGERFAAVYGLLPMVKIFDKSGAVRSTSLLNSWREQMFTIKNDAVKTSNSCQYYMAACANNDYICALYLGKRPADMQNMDMEDVRMEIHVWDWTGELEATYLPDKLINNIALAEDNTLYAVSMLDARNLYEYKIK